MRKFSQLLGNFTNFLLADKVREISLEVNVIKDNLHIHCHFSICMFPPKLRVWEGRLRRAASFVLDNTPWISSSSFSLLAQRKRSKRKDSPKPSPRASTARCALFPNSPPLSQWLRQRKKGRSAHLPFYRLSLQGTKTIRWHGVSSPCKSVIARLDQAIQKHDTIPDLSPGSSGQAG